METDKSLETGYGPATPAGDNLANDYAQGMAEAWAALAGARGDRTWEDADLGLLLTDAGSPALFGNLAVARRPLRDDEWREAAARMHGFYRGHPGGPFLLFSLWPTPDLVPAGFGRIGRPPLLLRLPAPLPGATAVGGLEIRPVSTPSEAEDWERTLVDGFPEPALQPFRPGCFLPAAAATGGAWRWWVGYLAGAPVGASAAYVGGHHVHVEFIATLETARGRGIGRAMTATATLADPDLPALLITSDAGRSVYERLGYRSLLRYTLWSGHRGG